MEIQSDTVANLVARVLAARGVTRVFALCGGHIMPIWMSLDKHGIRIIDVRDERAAVHMAHAHAELTGELGVALVTAGPGMTNTITGIANAHVSRLERFAIFKRKKRLLAPCPGSLIVRHPHDLVRNCHQWKVNQPAITEMT